MAHFSGGFRGWRARHGPHEWLGFAFDGGRAIRREEWKLVWIPQPFGTAAWKLYRLDRDPTELWDRAAKESDEERELLELWGRYVAENGVVTPTDDDEEGPVVRD